VSLRRFKRKTIPAGKNARITLNKMIFDHYYDRWVVVRGHLPTSILEVPIGD
jgi:hypothetical protein